MSYVDMHIKQAYESGIDDLVSDFYIPMMLQAQRYDRIAGFFSSSSLSLAARGIAGLVSRGGLMRLVTCPRLSQDDANIINKSVHEKIDLISDKLLSTWSVLDVEDDFERNHLLALGWMLAHDFLQIKIALVKSNGLVAADCGAGSSILHQKVGLFYDDAGNAVSFSGSNNETASGWLGNIEEFKTFKNWIEHQSEYFELDQKKFESFWQNSRVGVEVIDLPDAVKQIMIQDSVGFDIESIALDKYRKDVRLQSALYFVKKQELLLFSYQQKALDQWVSNDYRMMLEMATGTGKTRTAIGCMDYIGNHCDKSILYIVACPQSNLSDQWKSDIDSLNVSFDASVICDSTNSKWCNMLTHILMELNVGMLKSAVVYTTHKTCSSSKFIDIIVRLKMSFEIMFIGDEVHGLGSSKYRKGLLDLYEYRLGLSATPNRWFDDYGSNILMDYFGNSSFEFSVFDAQTNINPMTGRPFLVNYYYTPVFVKLTDDELYEYQRLSSKIVKMMSVHKDSDTESECLQNLMFKRANIEKNAESKYDALNDILDELKDDIRNTIIFVSSEQIDIVLEILENRHIAAHKFTQNEGTVHSEKYGGMSERAYIVQQFVSGIYQVLVAIKCLDEGIDIPSADTAIVMASSTNPREYIQRIGRVIRQAPGKSNARIYDLIIHPELSTDSVLGQMERKIFKKEMVRVKELSQNALNNTDVLSLIYEELGD